MNKKFMKEKEFKSWYKDLNNKHLIGSDDIDWLASEYVLRQLFNCETTMFFDFKSIYCREDIDLKSIKASEIVAIDLDTTKTQCISNHVTYLDNTDAINLNKKIPHGCSDYYKKFAGSTLVTILSLYDIDLSNFTEKQLELILCVDAAFKQYYYNNNTRKLFKYYYNEVLELPELVAVVEKHDINYFYDIIDTYKLHEKIYIDKNGYIKTKLELDKISNVFNIDLSLPKRQFIKSYTMQSLGKNLHEFKRTVDKDKIFSSAVTNNFFVKASVKY